MNEEVQVEEKNERGTETKRMTVSPFSAHLLEPRSHFRSNKMKMIVHDERFGKGKVW